MKKGFHIPRHKLMLMKTGTASWRRVFFLKKLFTSDTFLEKNFHNFSRLTVSEIGNEAVKGCDTPFSSSKKRPPIIFCQKIFFPTALLHVEISHVITPKILELWLEEIWGNFFEKSLNKPYPLQALSFLEGAPTWNVLSLSSEVSLDQCEKKRVLCLRSVNLKWKRLLSTWVKKSLFSPCYSLLLNVIDLKKDQILKPVPHYQNAFFHALKYIRVIEGFCSRLLAGSKRRWFQTPSHVVQWAYFWRQIALAFFHRLALSWRAYLFNKSRLWKSPVFTAQKQGCWEVYCFKKCVPRPVAIIDVAKNSWTKYPFIAMHI